MTEAQVKDELRQLEESGAILGYQAIIDWDRVKRESVTALIEVKVVPQSLDGFDRIAERIYQYDEVESMYLMSGAFDLTVIISGRTLREVAQFVGERLAPLEGVTGTATHFILKKYKENIWYSAARSHRKGSLSFHELRSDHFSEDPEYQALGHPQVF